MNERTDPYRRQTWANTQKHMLHQYKERFEFGGFAIGPDEELAIVRGILEALPDAMQSELTVESQTGLNIIIEDTRAVTNFKLTKDTGDLVDGAAGDFIQMVVVAANGDKNVTASIDSTGVYSDSSLAEFKLGMKDLTEKQIEKIIEGVNVYRFTKIGSDKIRVGPEAAEFHALTNYGDAESIAPGTVAGLALRLVKWVWNKVKGFEERIAALEAQSVLQHPPPPTEDTESS